MERRVISTKLTSIEVRTLCVLFLDSGKVGWFYDVHGYDIVLVLNQIRDVETCALERSRNVSDITPV